MDLPVTVHPQAATPIYLQIKYQLRYLITSGRLAERTRLPTVRAAADQLHVNTGTVAQAYRELHEEGLLDAAPGRGTFVAGTLPGGGDDVARRRLLDAALERALVRGRALGFSDEEIRQQVDAQLATLQDGMPVVLAAPTQAIGRKYATSLENRVGPGLAVRPVTFDEIERGASHVTALLQEAYYVITFAGLARRAEEALADLPASSQVLAFTTEVQPSTLTALDALRPTERLCVVTQEPYLPPVLRLIEQRTNRTPDQVRICLDGDVAGARDVLDGVDRVVYTFAARDFVVQMGVAPARRLEVLFDVTETSIARLRDVLLPNERDGATGDARDPSATETRLPAS
jgi:DNA-binding transcriptional regulator YhcF (GntR family)